MIVYVKINCLISNMFETEIQELEILYKTGERRGSSEFSDDSLRNF